MGDPSTDSSREHLFDEPAKFKDLCHDSPLDYSSSVPRGKPRPREPAKEHVERHNAMALDQSALLEVLDALKPMLAIVSARPPRPSTKR
jgi:hypothetical protein